MHNTYKPYPHTPLAPLPSSPAALLPSSFLYIVAPLFETLDDLTNAPQTLEVLLTSEWYKEHIQEHHAGVQEVMIGECDTAVV